MLRLHFTHTKIDAPTNTRAHSSRRLLAFKDDGCCQQNHHQLTNERSGRSCPVQSRKEHRRDEHHWTAYADLATVVIHPLNEMRGECNPFRERRLLRSEL